MGGEKIATAVQTTRHTGSPPRGRGKVLQRGMKQTELRITPAWAGKSYKNLFSAAMKKDHPRVGGEKSFTLIQPILAPGSPPRGRGKARQGWRGCVCYGITPAWAGKRLLREQSYTIKRDHPRVGGEKHLQKPFYFHQEGSPPRGRGKVHRTRQTILRSRITPAWAGKSRLCPMCQWRRSDHPRVGGEKYWRH